MSIWFSADHHFGHKRIIELSRRPFSSVGEMDETMIREWNDVVKENDTVYYLGDLSFHCQDTTHEILDRLNGKKFLVIGNHDEKRLNQRLRERFEWTKHYFDLKWHGMHIVLCHYPFETWDRACHGSWHLHGHSHGSLKTRRGGRLDVGVDCNNFRPWSLEEVTAYMTGWEYDPIDHHGA